MDIQKYRKWYLEENWGQNRFTMIEFYVEFPELRVIRNNRIMTIDFQRNHPKVLSGEGYWITHNKLCIGYKLRENPEIFRPIFSYKRQRFLDKVNLDIKKSKKFWDKVKSKYFKQLCKIKKVPIECSKHIVNFIY